MNFAGIVIVMMPLQTNEEEKHNMADNLSNARERARRDLAKRLGVPEVEIKEDGFERAEFPDASLGAPIDGEFSAQMISNGHRILLSHNDKGYEYRTSGTVLRLYKFEGDNHKVE